MSRFFLDNVCANANFLTFLFIFFTLYTGPLGPWATPPPTNIGAYLLACIAPPLPFWATIFFVDLNYTKKKINIHGSDPICLLIGPEGDFSIKERETLFKLKKIIPLNINKNILRTETAAISMISIISFILLS